VVDKWQAHPHALEGASCEQVTAAVDLEPDDAVPRSPYDDRYQLAFDDSAIGMAIEDLDGHFLHVNPVLCRMLGYERAELIGLPYQRVCHPDDVEDMTHLEALKSGALSRFVREMRYIRADGSVFWVRVHLGVISDDRGRPSAYTAQIEDISERHQAEQRFRIAFDDAAVGMAVTEVRGPGRDVLVEVNEAMARLLARTREDLVGRSAREFVHPDDAVATQAVLARLLAGTARQAEIVTRYVRPDGTVIWAHLSASVANGPEGQPAFLVIHLQDVTSRERAEARLIYQAEHDPLTDLPNRHVLAQQIAATLQGRDVAHSALLFIDLDRFKLVNDTLGHGAGDELLRAVGRRLQHALPAGDILARNGGDEFVLLARTAGTMAEAKRRANHIHAALGEPFEVHGRTLFVTASVGIAMADSTIQTADELLRAADLAMYKAKNDGRARTAVFEMSMQTDAKNRLATEQDLHHALVTAGELVPWFQPVWSLVTGHQVGAEALVRWHHPTRGLLAPGHFLSVAEETGLIIAMGRSILDQTLGQVRRWRDAGVGLVASVNLSGHQLSEPDFCGEVAAALDRWRLRPADLCLEVTETVLVSVASRAASIIQELREAGISIAIDDFGQGYSSLAYLRSHPVDVVKIDRAFVTTVDTRPRDAAIVGATIHLAHALGMTCIAEGVETREQLRRLADLGCDQVQGYLLGRPCPAEDFDKVAGQQSTSELAFVSR
jgi:diguanylate cyclase (GGDEF)-like protein/PAS domain S-box-containing protein